ncbi:hypothetical protein HGG82_16230 [Marinomonas sp. M1K-6]|uniref:Uncharacterized protein n=1 Tax=Marinomonas profundi TaxID=2726122 RepID=A0A847RFV5_9GAMM|nr:hypothetical protein [Marinomonas profundi]NLQ19150.1 hypothetical protein [Marinomonas profundi]UDV02043.1 hypothetical protein J8N69_10550 [Marinomonas profundi]
MQATDKQSKLSAEIDNLMQATCINYPLRVLFSLKITYKKDLRSLLDISVTDKIHIYQWISFKQKPNHARIQYKNGTPSKFI